MSKGAEQPNDSGREAMLAEARSILAAAQVAKDANTGGRKPSPIPLWAMALAIAAFLASVWHFICCKKIV